MAICKYCGLPFQWARVEDRWVLLVPVGDDIGLDRTFQDENGLLRANHRLVCTNVGGGAIHATRLAQPVPAASFVGSWTDPDPETGETHPLPPRKPSKRSRRKQDQARDDDIPFGPSNENPDPQTGH